MITSEVMRALAERRIWRSMHARCKDPHHKSYPRYGGRGIRVCEEWHAFDTFFSDMGPRPSCLHSIERKDNNGNYEPTNCIWATWRQQARNRRSNVHLTYQGSTKTIAEWAEVSGIKRHILYGRIALGWSVERTLSTPSLLAHHRPQIRPGDIFDRLRVMERVENDRHGKSRWMCICTCKIWIIVGGANLLRKITRSCGCLRRDSNRMRVRID